MHPEAFDDLTRSLRGRASRRGVLGSLGALSIGGVALPALRRGMTVRGQEVLPGTPIAVDSGGAATDGIVDEPAADQSPYDVRLCEQWILSGGVSPVDPIHIDDDLTLYLNDHAIFEDADGLTNIFDPIPFGAKNGDQLTAVARDQGSCRKIGALWLHCAFGGEPRFLTGGIDDGCDPVRAAPANFYRESWRI